MKKESYLSSYVQGVIVYVTLPSLAVRGSDSLQLYTGFLSVVLWKRSLSATVHDGTRVSVIDDFDGAGLPLQQFILTQNLDFTLGSFHFLRKSLLTLPNIDLRPEPIFKALLQLPQLDLVKVVAPKLVLRHLVWHKLQTSVV